MSVDEVIILILTIPSLYIWDIVKDCMFLSMHRHLKVIQFHLTLLLHVYIFFNSVNKSPFDKCVHLSNLEDYEHNVTYTVIRF